MVSKSYFLLYPLFIFAVIQSSSRPTFLKSFNEDIAGYLTSYANQEGLKSEINLDLSQRKKLVDQYIELSPKDKEDIYQKLEQYEQIATAPNFLITDTMLQELVLSIQSKHFGNLLMQEQEMSLEQNPEKVLQLINKSINEKIQGEAFTKKAFHEIILGLYFILCIITYLERGYSLVFLNNYIIHWIERLTVYIGIPILILFSPFIISGLASEVNLISKETFESFSDNLYNTYYSPPLKIIANILSVIGNLIIQYMTPIFLALSLFFVFFKKRLIELSLEPE